MHVFSSVEAIEILDCLTAAVLAAAASSRAHNVGAHFTGAVILGCICGIAGGVGREIFLNGSPGVRLLLTALPANALIGALAGYFAVRFIKIKKYAVFLWIDAASLGLATSLGAILGLPELGVVGALTLGLASGLTPSIIRDASLGDTAMAVEKSWYAMAAALGAMAAICCMLAAAIAPALSFWRIGEYAVLTGATITTLVRGLKGRKISDNI